jgi:hypothetical protein
MNCEYCGTIFSNSSSLNLHKKRAKYCIKIQNSLGIITENRNFFKCNMCSKELTEKNNLLYHLKNKCMKDLLVINDYLKDNINEKDEIIKNILNDNTKYKEEIIKLKSICNILESDHKNIQEIAKQPKNITNNNNKTLNLINSLNLSDTEQIKNVIDNNYNLEYIFSGQKGCAKFALENIIKDDNGNLKYICSDPSRYVYKFKDENGNIQKDVDAKKLTNLLVESGIKTKAYNLANEWCVDENGKTNVDKLELILDKTDSISSLQDDNTEFKKELAAMTSI